MTTLTEDQAVSRVALEVLDEGLDDWVQMWQLASLVVKVGGASDLPTVKRLALKTIRYLLESQLMEVGSIAAESGFKRWDLPLETSLAAIEAEWPTDRMPTLGDMCWLSNTERGDAYANTALSSSGDYAF